MAEKYEIEHAIGRVERVQGEGRGFQIDALPGKWLNTAPFGKPPRMSCPAVDEIVEVEYEGSYVRTWTLWDGTPNLESGEPIDVDVELPSYGLVKHVIHEGLRDDKPVVTRLACLNSAIASYGSLVADIPTDVLLNLAEDYVSWVLGVGRRDSTSSDASTADSADEASAPSSPSAGNGAGRVPAKSR